VSKIEWTDLTFGNHGDLMLRIGKKAAGDLLDGKQWRQYPEVR
jgi:hypothetical protein